MCKDKVIASLYGRLGAASLAITREKKYQELKEDIYNLSKELDGIMEIMPDLKKYLRSQSAMLLGDPPTPNMAMFLLDKIERWEVNNKG